VTLGPRPVKIHVDDLPPAAGPVPTGKAGTRQLGLRAGVDIALGGQHFGEQDSDGVKLLHRRDAFERDDPLALTPTSSSPNILRTDEDDYSRAVEA
jgi:hypothetical protein